VTSEIRPSRAFYIYIPSFFHCSLLPSVAFSKAGFGNGLYEIEPWQSHGLDSGLSSGLNQNGHGLKAMGSEASEGN
jgi:hypothetical protein